MRPEVAATLNSCATYPDLTPIGTKVLRLTNSVSVHINSLLKNNRFVLNQDGQIWNQIQIITAPVLIK